MKRKIRTEYFRRIKLSVKSKVYGGNMVRGINA